MEQKAEGSEIPVVHSKNRDLQKKRKSLRERAFEKIEVKKELRRLEGMLQDLKVEYEQFFLGLIPYRPDKLHKEVRRQIRRIRKAPFKKPAIKFWQLMLEQRYQTYNDYWQRTLRQKEEGTYSKDLFKAELKGRFAKEDQLLQSAKGSAAEGLRNLFQSYKQALEKHTGNKQNLDFEVFRQTLVKQARAHKEKLGGAKLSFHVVIKDGRVLIKAKAKGPKKAAGSPPG